MTMLRAMTNDDLLAYKRLCSVCYTYRTNDETETLPEELLHIRQGVFDADGRLLSAMMQIPYHVRFCGRTVRLVGVGGVVTDPAARGAGHVRRLFEEGLPRLYGEGYVFSALYPFSHRFYRKFGYEWAEFWRNAEIPRDAIRDDLPCADEVVRVLPGEDDQGMRSVYEAYIADKNLAVIRDDQMWTELRRGTPWADLKHAYVLKANGQTVAYWIGQMSKQGYAATLRITDMAWICPLGRDAIFAMLRGMNEVDTVAVRAQSGFDLRIIAKEPYDVGEKSSCTGMVRVVNAARALALLPPPLLPGRLSIGLTDGQIPQNNGCFVVSGDGYALTVGENDREEPDIVCGIEGLSALVAGRHSFRDAVDAGLVQVCTGKPLRFAELLFAERKLHMNQEF